MALKTKGTVEGAERAKKIVRDIGFIPGIHGDDHGELSCGFFTLWTEGRLTNVHPRLFNDNQISEILTEVQRIVVPGKHEEQRLVINLVPGYTATPNTQNFSIDSWLGQELGIPFETLLRVSAQTVELLSPVRTVRFIQ